MQPLGAAALTLGACCALAQLPAPGMELQNQICCGLWLVPLVSGYSWGRRTLWRSLAVGWPLRRISAGVIGVLASSLCGGPVVRLGIVPGACCVQGGGGAALGWFAGSGEAREWAQWNDYSVTAMRAQVRMRDA